MVLFHVNYLSKVRCTWGKATVSLATSFSTLPMEVTGDFWSHTKNSGDNVEGWARERDSGLRVCQRSGAWLSCFQTRKNKYPVNLSVFEGWHFYCSSRWKISILFYIDWRERTDSSRGWEEWTPRKACCSRRASSAKGWGVSSGLGDRWEQWKGKRLATIARSLLYLPGPQHQKLVFVRSFMLYFFLFKRKEVGRLCYVRSRKRFWT